MAPNIVQIQQTVGVYALVSRAELIGPSRRVPIAQVRQLAMAVAIDVTGKSLSVVGRAFRRHHTTVLHALGATAARHPVPRAWLSGVITNRNSALLCAPTQEQPA